MSVQISTITLGDLISLSSIVLATIIGVYAIYYTRKIAMLQLAISYALEKAREANTIIDSKSLMSENINQYPFKYVHYMLFIDTALYFYGGLNNIFMLKKKHKQIVIEAFYSQLNLLIINFIENLDNKEFVDQFIKGLQQENPTVPIIYERVILKIISVERVLKKTTLKYKNIVPNNYSVSEA